MAQFLSTVADKCSAGIAVILSEAQNDNLRHNQLSMTDRQSKTPPLVEVRQL
jgi:hypothetical protein